MVSNRPTPALSRYRFERPLFLEVDIQVYTLTFKLS